jgi:hypothetical protein
LQPHPTRSCPAPLLCCFSHAFNSTFQHFPVLVQRYPHEL